MNKYKKQKILTLEDLKEEKAWIEAKINELELTLDFINAFIKEKELAPVEH